ncbi:TonB-dependent receptor [Pseudomonas sp. ABC1]|nr:TonB-dependent receptor [Pseudomonas sp. ABC1]
MLEGSGLQAQRQGNGGYVLLDGSHQLELGATRITSARARREAAEDRGSLEFQSTLVTATRTPRSIAEIAGAVQIIDQQQIAQQAASGRKISDVLAQLVPSLAPSSGTTSNYGQTMRGRNVLIMIDGVSQTGSRDASRQLNSISPSLIERVEVLSGATSIYGSGATGGVINIITRRADAATPLSFETRAGVTTGDQFRGDGLAYELGQTVSFARDDVDGFLGANVTRRGLQFDGDGKRIGTEPYQTSRQDTDTLDLNSRVNVRLDENQSLSLGVQYYKEDQNTDYAPDYGPGYSAATGPQSYEGVKGLKLSDQPFTKRYALNTQYQNLDVFGQVLNLEAYYRKEQLRFFPVYSGTAFANQSESDIDIAGLRSTIQSDLVIGGRTLALTYGADYDYEKDRLDYDLLRASDVGRHYEDTGKRFGGGPDTTIQSVGGFLQGEYGLTDRLSLQAGLRYQYIRADADAYIPSRQAQRAAQGQSADLTPVASDSTDADKVLFNLGAVYKLTDDQQVFANFSQGFSFPDVQRMLRDVGTISVSEANIEPITVNNYELGWRWLDPRGMELGLTGFYNTSDKVVQFNADRSANLADTDQRVYGAELTASYPIADVFSVGGTLAYTRGQFKDAAGKWRELNAYQISPGKATLFAEWDSLQGYGARVQLLAVQGTDKAYKDGLKAVTDANVQPNTAADINGYAVMDVLAHVSAFEGRLDFGVYNALNRQYRTVYSQQSAVTFAPVSSIYAQGRTYALSYTINY